MDFTPQIQLRLLQVLQQADYHFITFREYCEGQRYDKFVILRHDVEKHYDKALAMAKAEHQLNIRGSYYFRFTSHYSVEVVKQIAALGHEVGYHYDDLSFCKGNVTQAFKRFENNIKQLRTIAEVKTIAMEGAPRSKYDNKDLWQENNYRDYALIGEPYFDADFDDLFYLTDTGRRWDGWKVSVRDKVPQQAQWVKDGLVFHSTEDIIDALRFDSAQRPRFDSVVAERSRSTQRPRTVSAQGSLCSGTLPDKIMMTFHPQRWHNKALPWFKELVLQNAKNVVKRFLLRR